MHQPAEAVGGPPTFRGRPTRADDRPHAAVDPCEAVVLLPNRIRKGRQTTVFTPGTATGGGQQRVERRGVGPGPGADENDVATGRVRERRLGHFLDRTRPRARADLVGGSWRFRRPGLLLRLLPSVLEVPADVAAFEVRAVGGERLLRESQHPRASEPGRRHVEELVRPPSVTITRNARQRVLWSGTLVIPTSASHSGQSLSNASVPR